MATADHTHGERLAPAAADVRGAHAAHGDHHGHAAHGHAAHGAHHPDEVAGDKRAAYIGLFAGAALLGSLIYGMVLWTNARFAGHEGGEKAAETSTR